MLVLLSPNFVENTRHSCAMPAFFALLMNKITAPGLSTLFLNRP